MIQTTQPWFQNLSPTEYLVLGILIAGFVVILIVNHYKKKGHVSSIDEHALHLGSDATPYTDEPELAKS